MLSVIINPVSGGATPVVARQRAELAAARMAASGTPGHVFVTERRGHACEFAAAAAARGDTRVVAWGGDGTVNEVGSVLAGTATAVGIVASGSGNGLARELGLPTTSSAALDHAFAATPRAIDAGRMNGRWFFSIAGVGFDAHVASLFDQASGRRGFMTYARVVARELLRYRAADYRIDGVPVSRALLVTVANSAQFGNGARIAPAARLDDGLLNLVVFAERSRLATILALPKLFAGDVAQTRGATARTITDVTIESDAPMRGHVDGEPFEAGVRVAVRVLPKVLLVAG